MKNKKITSPEELKRELIEELQYGSQIGSVERLWSHAKDYYEKEGIIADVSFATSEDSINVSIKTDDGLLKFRLRLDELPISNLEIASWIFLIVIILATIIGTLLMEGLTLKALLIIIVPLIFYNMILGVSNRISSLEFFLSMKDHLPRKLLIILLVIGSWIILIWY